MNTETCQAKLAEQEAELTRLRQLIYMPGEWICDKCNFIQHSRVLNVVAGTVGAPRIEEVQICPNDGSTMRKVTWKESNESNYAFACRLMNKNSALEQKDQKLIESIKGALHCLQHSEEYEHPQAVACDWLEAALTYDDNPNQETTPLD